MKKRSIDICAGVSLLLVSFLQIVQSTVVTEPPLVIYAHKETVEEGDSILLTCNFTGPNPQTITWLKDGQPLNGQYSIINNALNITSANSTIHSGDYQCIHEDTETLYSNIFTLTVKNFDHLVLCEPTDGLPVYNREDDITFQCCFTGSSTPPTYGITWRNSMGDIVSNTSTFTIASLVRDDAGEYECSDSLGNQHKVILFVPFTGAINGDESAAITSPDPVVCAEVGGVAILPFEVLGDVNEMWWIFEGKELKHSEYTRYVLHSNKFVIYGVQETDFGVHTIYAKDSLGGTQIVLIELKKDCIESVSINPPSLVTVGLGMITSLECAAEVETSLHIDPIYTWLLTNGSIHKGPVLTLTDIDYEDSGVYRCTADNQVSMPQVDGVEVSVKGPLLVKTDVTDIQAKLNHTLKITCTTNTTGTVFVWKNGTDVIDGRSISLNWLSSDLTIERFTEYDEAVYSCEVHKDTHVTVTANITVALTPDIYLLWDNTAQSGIIRRPFTLTCPVAGGQGVLASTWLRNDTAIPLKQDSNENDPYIVSEIDRVPQVFIPSLDMAYEYDVFTCVTTDSEGRTFSQNYKIIVEIPAVFINLDPNESRPPINAYVGAEVEFKCEVMGKPMPAIIWNRVQGQKPHSPYENFTNGTFRIHNVQIQDQGNYYCSFKWKESNNPQSLFFKLSVAPRQVGSANSADTGSTESTILGLEQNVFIAIIVAAVGGLFLVLAFVLCCCLICRFCCCQKQRESEIPRIALETTSFERKPSLRGSYRFKDNSGILDKNTSQNTWTFQKNNNANATVIPLTAASSVAVSPGPPIPSPVPTTPAGPTTSMVTSPEFQLPNNVASFPRQNLKLDNVMGEGEFGPVFKGVARNILQDEQQSLVAVKVLISRDGEDLWPSLMEFANQMKLSSPHIASIIGICPDADPYYVIYDYLDQGDLKQFLNRSRPSPNAQPPPLTQSELLHIVTQVSTGMSYLYRQQIIHGDLATRNCLISSNLTVKIADLGIGHDLYPGDYHDNGAQLLPIRWMSPELFVEASESPAFSLASDVWSFGIFCWEVFAYARQPYEEFTDAQILRLIPEGHVLSAPEEGCPPLLFSIMQECWAPTVQRRPFFTDITTAILSIDLD